MGYVEIEYTSPLPTAFEPAFTNAVNFWNRVITRGHSGVEFTRPVNLRPCGLDFSIEAGDFIEGIRIYSSITPIDGPNGILGQAGPCLLNEQFPMVGIMMYDSADAEQLLNRGNFETVVVHEMAHIVGLGSLWNYFGMVDDPCGNGNLFGICTGNPTYNGNFAKQAYVQLGGNPDDELLVGDERGPGTWDAHWRESVFVNELMTGFLDADMPNPMSILSVKSYQDLGYEVDESMAEEYFIPSTYQRPFNAEKIEIFGDALVFDLDDYRLHEIEPEVAEVTTDNVSNEIGGIIGLMIIGFTGLAALMYYNNSRQTEAIKRIAASRNVLVPSPQRDGTKNAMYQP